MTGVEARGILSKDVSTNVRTANKETNFLILGPGPVLILADLLGVFFGVDLKERKRFHNN